MAIDNVLLLLLVPVVRAPRPIAPAPRAAGGCRSCSAGFVLVGGRHGALPVVGAIRHRRPHRRDRSALHRHQRPAVAVPGARRRRGAVALPLARHGHRSRSRCASARSCSSCSGACSACSARSSIAAATVLAIAGALCVWPREPPPHGAVAPPRRPSARCSTRAWSAAARRRAGHARDLHRVAAAAARPSRRSPRGSRCTAPSASASGPRT